MTAGNLDKLISKQRWDRGKKIKFLSVISKEKIKFPATALCLEKKLDKNNQKKVSYDDLKDALYVDVVGGLTDSIVGILSKEVTHSTQSINKDIIIDVIADYWKTDANFLCDIYAQNKYSTILKSFNDAITELCKNILNPQPNIETVFNKKSFKTICDERIRNAIILEYIQKNSNSKKKKKNKNKKTNANKLESINSIISNNIKIEHRETSQQDIIGFNSNPQKKEQLTIKLQRNTEIKQPKINERKLLIDNIKVDIKKKDDEKAEIIHSEPVKYSEFAKQSSTQTIVNSKAVDKIPAVDHKKSSDIQYIKLLTKDYNKRLPKKLPDNNKKAVDDTIDFSKLTSDFVELLKTHISKKENQKTFEDYNKNEMINKAGKTVKEKFRPRSGREKQVLSLSSADNFITNNHGLDYFQSYEKVYTDISNEIHFGGKSRLQVIAHNGLDALTGVRNDNGWGPATIAADSNPYLNEFRILRDLYDYKRFYEKSWKNRRGIPAERKQQYTDAIKLIESMIKDNKKFSTELPELIKIRDQIKIKAADDKLAKCIDDYIKQLQPENNIALGEIFNVNKFDSQPLLKLMSKYNIDITDKNLDVPQLMNLFGPDFEKLKTKLITYFENIKDNQKYEQVGNPQYLFISKLIGIAEKVNTNEDLKHDLNETTRQLEKSSKQERESKSKQDTINRVAELFNKSDWQALIDRVLDVSDRVTDINLSEKEKTEAINSYFDLHDAIVNTFDLNTFLDKKESNERTFHTLVNNDFFDIYFQKLIELEKNENLNQYKDNIIILRKYFEKIVLQKLETFSAYIKQYPTAIETDSTFATSFERMMANKTIKELYERQQKESPQTFTEHKNKQISIIHNALLGYANKQTKDDPFDPLLLMDLINGVAFINYEGEKLPLTKAIENDPLKARDIEQIKPHLRYAFIQFIQSKKYNVASRINYIVEKLAIAKDWYEELGNSSEISNTVDDEKLNNYKDDKFYTPDVKNKLEPLIEEYLLQLLKTGDEDSYQALDKIIDKKVLFTLHGVKYANPDFMKDVFVGKQHKNLLDNLKELEENKGGLVFDQLKMKDKTARNLAYFLSPEERQELKKQLATSSKYKTVSAYQKEILKAFKNRIEFWEGKIYENESRKTLQNIYKGIKKSEDVLSGIEKERLPSKKKESLDFEDDLQALSLLSAYPIYLANIEMVKNRLKYLNELTASTVPNQETLNEETVSLKNAIHAINTLNLTKLEEKLFIEEIAPLLDQAKSTLRSILIGANEEQQKAYLNTYNSLIQILPVIEVVEHDKKQAGFLVDSIKNGEQTKLISKCNKIIEELIKDPEKNTKNKVIERIISAVSTKQDHIQLCKELFDQLSPDNITLLHFCLPEEVFNKKIEGEPLLTALLSAIDKSIKTNTLIDFISIIADNIQQQPCSKTYIYLVMRFGSHEQVKAMHINTFEFLKNQDNNTYFSKNDYLDAIEMVRKEGIDPYRHLTIDKGIYDSCNETNEQWNKLIDHLIDKQDYDLAAYILQGHGSDAQYLQLKNIRVLEHLKTVVNNKEKNSPEEKLLLLLNTSEKLFCGKSIESIAETLSLAITTTFESLESDLFQSICELYNQALSAEEIAKEVKSQLLLNFKNNFLDILKNPAAKEYIDLDRRRSIVGIITKHVGKEHAIECYEAIAGHYSFVIANQFSNIENKLADIWTKAKSAKLDKFPAKSQLSQSRLTDIADQFITKIKIMADSLGSATGDKKAIQFLTELMDEKKSYAGLLNFVWKQGSTEAKELFRQSITKILDKANDVEFISLNTLTIITDIFAKHGEQECVTKCYGDIARHCSWVIDNQIQIQKPIDEIWSTFNSNQLDTFLPEKLKNSSLGEHYLKSIVEKFTSPLEKMASQLDLSSNNQAAITFLQNLGENKKPCEGLLDFVWKHGPENTKESFKNYIKLPIKSSATGYIASEKLKIITNIITMVAKHNEIDYATECYNAIKDHCRDVISSHLKTKKPKLPLDQVWNNFKSSGIVTTVIEKLKENSSKNILGSIANKFIFEIETIIPQLNLLSDNHDAINFLQQLGEDTSLCKGMLEFVCKYGSEKTINNLKVSITIILSNTKSQEFISSEKLNIMTKIMSKLHDKIKCTTEYYDSISKHCVSVIDNKIDEGNSLGKIWESFNTAKSNTVPDTSSTKNDENRFKKLAHSLEKKFDGFIKQTFSDSLAKTLEKLHSFQDPYLENIANKFLLVMQKPLDLNSGEKEAIEFLQKLGDNEEPYKGMLEFVWKNGSKKARTEFKKFIREIHLPEKLKTTFSQDPKNETEKKSIFSSRFTFSKPKEINPQEVLEKFIQSLDKIEPKNPLNKIEKDVENEFEITENLNKGSPSTHRIDTNYNN